MAKKKTDWAIGLIAICTLGLVIALGLIFLGPRIVGKPLDVFVNPDGSITFTGTEAIIFASLCGIGDIIGVIIKATREK